MMVTGEKEKNGETLQPYLLRYGEIGTKSTTIRKHFENILIDNIERFFLTRDKEVITEKKGLGRIFAYTYEENSYLFSRIFGIVSYSRVKEISSNLEDIEQEAKNFARDIVGSFAVRARRVGQHEYTSQDIENEIGRIILKENPNLQVDLDEPENEFHIEIRHSRAYIFIEIEDGPGGLPLSSQGKFAACIKDRYDFLATWMIMKRGARPYVAIEDENYYRRLKLWESNLQKIDTESFDKILSKNYSEDIHTVVSGERLENYSIKDSETMTIRPLIGFTEERIEKVFESIEELENRGKE